MNAAQRNAHQRKVALGTPNPEEVQRVLERQIDSLHRGAMFAGDNPARAAEYRADADVLVALSRSLREAR